jgi:hypothetical protein
MALRMAKLLLQQRLITRNFLLGTLKFREISCRALKKILCLRIFIFYVGHYSVFFAKENW